MAVRRVRPKLSYSGTDLYALPRRARRQQLRALLEKVESPLVRFSDDLAEVSHSLLASAPKMEL